MAKWERFLQILSVKYLFHQKVCKDKLNDLFPCAHVDKSSVSQRRNTMRAKADPNLLMFSAGR